LFWPRVKFLPFPDATTCHDKSQKAIMTYWSVNHRNQEAADAFVRDHWGAIVKALNVRRNNSIRLIKDLFSGKLLIVCFGREIVRLIYSNVCVIDSLFLLCLAAVKNKDLAFPGIARIKRGREDREAFEFALEHLMKGVSSYKKWTRTVGTRGRSLSDVLTCTDEAWFLLVVENYEDVWNVDLGLVQEVPAVKPTPRWTGKDKFNNRKGKGKLKSVLLM
jgi:hypothetical protein